MTEAQIQREIVQHLLAWGFTACPTSQGYRSSPGGTRVHPGLPDLWVMGNGLGFWCEVKRAKPRGKLRPEQEVFRDQCLANGVGWLVAWDVRDVFDYLVALGAVEEAAA